jgi:NitT/TauT family transport system permease protein
MSMRRHTAARFGGYALLGLLLLGMARSLGLGGASWPELNVSWPLLGHDLARSFGRAGSACLAAWGGAALLGYLLWARPLADRLLLPVVNFVRAIPPLAWLPFAIFWFGLGEAPVFFILLVALFFPCLIAARDAFAQVDRDFVDEARVLGAGGWRLFGQVMLPLALPALLTLLRVAWGLGWGTVIAAEMLGVQSGLGFRLLDFRFLVQYPPMLVYLVVMGLVGIGVDRGLRAAAARAADPLTPARPIPIIAPALRATRGQP